MTPMETTTTTTDPHGLTFQAVRLTHVARTGTVKATVQVTASDGRTWEAGGKRALRAAAVILTQWDEEPRPGSNRTLGIFGLRANPQAAVTEAAKLERGGKRTHAGWEYEATAAHFATAVMVEEGPVTGPGAPTPEPTEEPAPAVEEPAEEPAEEPQEATEEDTKAEDLQGLPAPSGSALVAALEATWSDVQARHPDLPNVVIITGSGLIGRTARWGHYWGNRWREARCQEPTAHPEMFIAGERLATGARLTLQTLLHEAAHALAEAREVEDTSRGGAYHNRRFLALAEELGLRYAEEEPSTIGFSEVVITDETAEAYAETIARLDAAITVALAPFEDLEEGGEETGGDRAPVAKTRPGAGGRSNDRLLCACETPRIIRASRKVAEEAPIVCGLCLEPFQREVLEDEEGEEEAAAPRPRRTR